NKWNVR
ncbi:hypothetical protein ACTFIR_003974, partial [Dictyostelium discoideum]